MLRAAAMKNSTITTPSPVASHSLVRALAWMPRRFSRVNVAAKNTAYTWNGTSGTKFSAALLHQITQMIGFMT